MKMKLEKELIL